MSRTSKTLLRLGVPTLAAATMVAGVPAFFGVAQAAPVDTVTFVAVDGTDTAAAGSCQAYYVDAEPVTAGASTVGETINVVLNNAAGGAASDAAFCTLPQIDSVTKVSITPAAGTVVSAGGPNGTVPTTASTTDQARFTLGAIRTSAAGDTAATPGSTGQAIVGITRNQVGTGVGAGAVEATAYTDTNNNGSVDAAAGESTQGNQTVIFTDGGANASNENQDAAETVEVLNQDQVDKASATVDDDTTTPRAAVAGEARNYSVLVTNADSTTGAPAVAGDQLEGVTVNYTVSTPNAVTTTVFGVTDNNGIVSGTITLPTAGAGNNITFFVNQTGGTSDLQTPGEPSDVVRVTAQAAPAARTIALTPQADADATGSPNAATYQTSPAINPRTDTNRNFLVVVDNAATGGTNSAGTLVRVAVSGGSGDETVAIGGGTATNGFAEGSTADYTTTSTPADPSTTNTTNSFLVVTVNNPSALSGENLVVTATVRGQATNATSGLSFVAVPADARNVDLTPDPATTTVNTARTFTATVIDGRGNPVFNVPVTFSESGPGAFRNGASSLDPIPTARNGQASAEVIALTGESGTQTITSTITNSGNRTADLANVNNGVAQPGLRAGNNSDTATNNVVASSPTTTPPTTPAPAPGSATGTVKLQATVADDTIVPTEQGVITVTGTPNANVDLFAYSRPNTTLQVVRSVSLGADGRTVFRILPGTNTRLEARYRGQDTPALTSNSVVQNVATALSLTVVRNGSLDYTFQGRILPRRAGQLITLYRVEGNREIITSQIKTDSTGTWRIRRIFTGQGTFGFLARTGQNLTNVAGVSNEGQARPTSIYSGPQR